MNLIALSRDRFRRSLAEKGEPVVLKWRVATGGTVDATTGSVLGGSALEQQETVNCFVYALDEGAKVKLERFQGVSNCDYMIDAPDDITIEGRDELVFVVRGEACAQADLGAQGGNKIGRQIEQGQGVALSRTFYLQRI